MTLDVLEIYERLGLDESRAADLQVVLDHAQREKGRLRLRAASGEEVRIFLERGSPLQVGELLRSRCGRLLRVQAAQEPLVLARCADWQRFSRACYHLGNRHVKVEVGERWLRLQPDHVLEEMLRGLGLSLSRQTAAFLQEAGAYGHSHGHSHSHGAGHGHSDGEGHSHSDGEGHGHRHSEGHGHRHSEGHGHRHSEGHNHGAGHSHSHSHGHSGRYDPGHDHSHDHAPAGSRLQHAQAQGAAAQVPRAVHAPRPAGDGPLTVQPAAAAAAEGQGRAD